MLNGRMQETEKSRNISPVYWITLLYLIIPEAYSHIRLEIWSLYPKSDFYPWINQDENTTLIFASHHQTQLNFSIIYIPTIQPKITKSTRTLAPRRTPFLNLYIHVVGYKENSLLIREYYVLRYSFAFHFSHGNLWPEHPTTNPTTHAWPTTIPQLFFFLLKKGPLMI